MNLSFARVLTMSYTLSIFYKGPCENETMSLIEVFLITETACIIIVTCLWLP